MKMKESNCSLVLVFSAVVLMLYSPPVSARRLIVGGRHGWTAGTNFTYWAHQQASFRVGDILVFFHNEEIGDVLLVDKAAFEKCDCSQPFSSHGEGTKYEFQLNQAGDYYFINNYYCEEVQMKLAIRVEPLLAPLVHPSSQAIPLSPSPRRLVVGGRHGWTSGNNFTYWAHQHEPFHVGDLLVFFGDKEIGDVLLVDKTAFEKCDCSQPFSRHGEGTKFQLSQAGDYYFINSYDCEEHQMKLAIRVESLIAPFVLPSSQAIPSSPSPGYQPSLHASA